MGAPPSSGVAGPAAPQPFDVRRRPSLAEPRAKVLRAIHERLAELLEAWLARQAQLGVRVTLASVEQVPLRDIVAGLATPCAANTVDIKPAGGAQGMIELGRDFSFALVDRLFGGGGVPIALTRALTPIERMVVRSAAEAALRATSAVWSDHVPLDLELTGFESVPELLRIARREDVMLAVRLEVTFVGSAVPVTADPSHVLVCLPASTFDAFFAPSDRRVGPSEVNDADRALAERSVRGARMTLAARLPAFRLTLQELAALTPGTVIPTGVPCTARAEVMVGDQLRFLGATGRVGSALAVSITDVVADESAPLLPLLRS